MFSHKGVSPLIATVLFIGFSVALAAMVSTFVIQKTKEFDPSSVVASSYCEQAALALGSTAATLGESESGSCPIGGDYLLAQDLSLVNKGAFSIHKISYTPPGQNSLEFALEPILAPGASDVFTFGYCSTLAAADGAVFKFTPWIQDPETQEVVPCPMRELQVPYSAIQSLGG